MNENEIRTIFTKVFNGKHNPIFFLPVRYFSHGEYVCEVAAAEKNSSLANHFKRIRRNPLCIFDALFTDDGFWVTVLKKEGKEYVRTDLSDHIDSLNELDNFIKQKLN